MGTRYSEDVKTFIADNVQGMTTRDLVELVNKEFGTAFTDSKMKSYKNNHKLKSGTLCGLPAGRPTKLFPKSVQTFINENHMGVGPKDMVKLINEKFGTSYTREHIKNYYNRHNISSGLNGRFQKGNVPFNKGKKTGGGPEYTLFKKGQMPANHLPVGSEVMRSDGYLQVKIAEPNVWRLKHLLVWERANGKKPENHVLLFRDGDTTNTELENLKLISKSQLAVLNRRGLLTSDKEINETAVLTADLILKTKAVQRNRKRW